jgi:hypothetical protein
MDSEGKRKRGRWISPVDRPNNSFPRLSSQEYGWGEGVVYPAVTMICRQSYAVNESLWANDAKQHTILETTIVSELTESLLLSTTSKCTQRLSFRAVWKERPCSTRGSPLLFVVSLLVPTPGGPSYLKILQFQCWFAKNIQTNNCFQVSNDVWESVTIHITTLSLGLESTLVYWIIVLHLISIVTDCPPTMRRLLSRGFSAVASSFLLVRRTQHWW